MIIASPRFHNAKWLYLPYQGSQQLQHTAAAHQLNSSGSQQGRRHLRQRADISVDDLAMALVVFSYANPFADQLQLEERIFTIGGQLLRIEQVQHPVHPVLQLCSRTWHSFFGILWRMLAQWQQQQYVQSATR